MGHNLDDTIQLFAMPFEEPKLNQIQKAADILGLPLEENVFFNHYGDDKIRTKNPVPVGYLHIKRVQQLLSKKNRYGLDIESTELKTSQVKGESKVASLSDNEVFSLAAIHADKTLEEFLGPRADAMMKKQDFYKQIVKNGYCTLDELPQDPQQHSTLNTISTYLTASGIKNDFITKTLKTVFTINNEKNLTK